MIQEDLYNFFIDIPCQNCNKKLKSIIETAYCCFDIFCDSCQKFIIKFNSPSFGWNVEIQKPNSFAIRFVTYGQSSMFSYYIYDNNYKIMEYFDFQSYNDMLESLYNFKSLYIKYNKLSVLF